VRVIVQRDDIAEIAVRALDHNEGPEDLTPA
jgi:hypothetical protein